MSFPRVAIEGLSVSRMIAGTNWLLGFSHTSKAKDDYIKDIQDRRHIAAILDVFMAAGVDTLLGVRPESPHLLEAIADTEQRHGHEMKRIGTPHLDLTPGQKGLDATAAILDDYARIGTHLCLPHQASTDALVDRRTHEIRDMDVYTRMIRERGMIPGLSTHMPETVVYADERQLDVATYIQIYNAAGFLMQVEVDWVHRIIHQARKPVITIKPMAAGRLLPLVGLAFAWATIRDQDMVCLGCMTPDEARECIDISLAQLEQRSSTVALQETRSKASLAKK